MLKGFVQPADLPTQLESAGGLVVPSNRDAWSLAIHEATAAGLIIVATETVGAIPHLVQNYYNGFVVQVGDSAGLARAMSQVSEMEAERRERMSRASHQLSNNSPPRVGRMCFLISQPTVSLVNGRDYPIIRADSKNQGRLKEMSVLEGRFYNDIWL